MSKEENSAVQVVYTEVTDSVAFSQIQDLLKAKKVGGSLWCLSHLCCSHATFYPYR